MFRPCEYTYGYYRELRLRTGLVGIIPAGTILRMKKTVLFDERAGGGYASGEADVGGNWEAYGGCGVLYVVPEDRRGRSLIRIDG